MTKEQFIAHYAATFMATNAANRYDRLCFNGNSGRLAEKDAHPAEDALFIAEAAWAAFKERATVTDRFKPECAVD